jgi:hypothetical protein
MSLEFVFCRYLACIRVKVYKVERHDNVAHVSTGMARAL